MARTITHIDNDESKPALFGENDLLDVAQKTTFTQIIFEMLTDARKAVMSASGSGDVNKMAEASGKLDALLPKLTIAVESNPELKSSEVVQNLINELRDTADKVMYARRLMIDLTADYNVRRVTFPTSLIANMFHFEDMKGLITPNSGEFGSVSDEETKTPKISL